MQFIQPIVQSVFFQALSEEDVNRIFGRSSAEIEQDLNQAKPWSRDYLLMILFFFKNSAKLVYPEQKSHSQNTTQIEHGKARLSEEIKQRDRRKRRAVTSLPERRWPNAVIPYKISENFTADQRSIFSQDLGRQFIL